MSGTRNRRIPKRRGHCSSKVAFTGPILFLTGLWSLDAAPFQNLNFESSPSFPPGNGSLTIYANALPGWTVHVDNTIQNGAWANEFILDAPGVALMTVNNNPMDGQKSVYLQSAFSAPTNLSGAHTLNVSISQVGLVPAGSQSLHFDSLNQWFDFFPVPPGPFDIKLGGMSLSLVPTFSNGGYVQYAADVAAWQGQTVELTIGVLASPAWRNTSFPEGWAYVDSISFSPTAVPEPSVAVLIGCVGLLVLRRFGAAESNAGRLAKTAHR